MPKHKRFQPDQQSLLPTFAQGEAERRALVRGALDRLGVRRQIGWELECMILYLDQFDDGHGCGAFAATLARVPRRAGQPPMAPRTLERRMDRLRSLGLIESRWSGPGRRRHRVNWWRIRELARQTNAPQASSLKPQACPKKVADYSAKVADYSAKVADSYIPDSNLIPETSISPLSPRQSPSERTPPGVIADVGTPATAGKVCTVAPAQADMEGEEICFWSRQAAITLESALAERGFAAVDLAIRTARERGLSPAFVRAAIEHWDRQAPAWQPGGILICLRRAQPGDDPQDPRLWPPKSPAAQRAARAEVFEQVSARREAEQLATRQAADLDRQQACDRERRLGEQLDRLSGKDFSQLAVRLPAAYQKMFARDLVQRAHGEPLTNALVREQLLLLLDQPLT